MGQQVSRSCSNGLSQEEMELRIRKELETKMANLEKLLIALRNEMDKARLNFEDAHQKLQLSEDQRVKLQQTGTSFSCCTLTCFFYWSCDCIVTDYSSLLMAEREKISALEEEGSIVREEAFAQKLELQRRISELEGVGPLTLNTASPATVDERLQRALAENELLVEEKMALEKRVALVGSRPLSRTNSSRPLSRANSRPRLLALTGDRNRSDLLDSPQDRATDATPTLRLQDSMDDQAPDPATSLSRTY